MHRLLALLILAIAVAAPASAQDSARMKPAIPAGDGAGLRGTVGEPGESGDEKPAARGDLSALVPAPVPVQPTGFTDGAAARQCRRACAQEYYFCLSAEDEICPPQWVKCTARCGS